MLRNLKAMYRSIQACVMSISEVSGYFECFQGLKQGCVASLVLFSLLINELTNEIIGKAKHGIPLGPTEIELFTLLASTVIGRQNQLNALSVAAKRLGLTVNLDKSKVMVFGKGGYLAAKERWFWDDKKLEVVNTYKYLGLIFSAGHSFTAAMEDITKYNRNFTNTKNDWL